MKLEIFLDGNNYYFSAVATE